MKATQSYKTIGDDLQMLSQSATWKHYLTQHPRTKIRLVTRGDGRILFTLTDAALGHRGVVRYAETAQGLIAVAQDALWQEGEIECL